jgi:DUF4097 and DUF4098 domain-containing protein YvlB
MELLVAIFAFFGVNQLFAVGSLELVNSQTVDMNFVKTLNISYSSDNIVLFESNDNRLILKEFMTRNSPRYFANIEKSQDAVSISNGARPSLIRTRIEIYVPKLFTGNLAFNLKSGNLTSNYNINHTSVNLTVSSGNMNITGVSSENISLKVSSGNIKINSCQGKINAVCNSGNITVDNFSGGGMFDVKSGNINLTMNDIIGDLSLSVNSGVINLITNGDISYVLDADVRSGNIRIPDFKTRTNTKARHIIGSNPIYRISAKCGSGNINIK